MKKYAELLKTAVALLMVFQLASCVSSKKIVYFQDVAEESPKGIFQNFEQTIEPDDMLSINITTADPSAAAIFNLGGGVPSLSDSGVAQNSSGSTYLVNSVGEIVLPVLGTLQVAGLTTRELSNVLKTKLKDYLTKPIVVVQLTNFKVTVLGEVQSPGTIQVPGERLTIVEALSQAGDLSILGKRKNILLIRENKGERIYATIDLTSKELFESPYYYLAQNDVIYVEPRKVKINSSGVGASTGLFIGSLGALIGLAALFTR